MTCNNCGRIYRQIHHPTRAERSRTRLQIHPDRGTVHINPRLPASQAKTDNGTLNNILARWDTARPDHTATVTQTVCPTTLAVRLTEGATLQGGHQLLGRAGL